MKIVLNGREVSREQLPDRSKRFRREIRSRKCARVMTDDVFLAGMTDIAHEPDAIRDGTVELLKRHGYTPKSSDVYMPEVARFPGDPEAVFNHGTGRGELKKRLERRGVECGGDGTNCAVRTKGRSIEPPKPVKLAPDLVAEEYRNRVSDDPSLQLRDKREVMEQIVDECGAPE